jgi:hypothetical protein
LKRRRETSYNGVPTAVLKSALQKYARRGLLDSGLWCLAELDLFSLVEAGAFPAEDVRRAAALRTNLLNRLIVMVPEDVGIAEWWLPLVAGRLVAAWQACRRQDASRKHLVDLYKYLAAARKLRLVSDLKSVHLLPPDYVKPAQGADLQLMHADLVRSLGLADLYTGCDDEPEDLLAKCPGVLRLDRGDADLRRIFNGVLHHLARESDHAFAWVARLLDRQRGPDGEPRLRGRDNPVNGLWRLLEAFAVRGEALWGGRPVERPANFGRLGDVLAVLRGWYDAMTHRERPIYLYHAILLVVRRGRIDWESQPPVIDTPADEVARLYAGNLAGEVVPLDPFVYDLHTGVREAGARARFAREGAFVTNEDAALRNEDYRRIYHGLKERLDVYEERGLAAALALGGTA